MNMGVGSVDKVELNACQLKGVFQVLFDQWNDKKVFMWVILIRRSLKFISMISSFPFKRRRQRYLNSLTFKKGICVT